MDASLYDHPDLYDALLPASDACIAFYADLAERHSGSVLELACGTGRLSVALAQRGLRVVGIDISGPMLETAVRRANASGAIVAWHRCDMRSFDLKERFGSVIIARNSMLHLHTASDFEQMFAAVRAHIDPDGIFAFDVFNPDVRLLGRRAAERSPLMRTSEIRVEETFSYDAARQVGTSRWFVTTSHEQFVVSFELRSIFPQELPLLIERGGFALRDRYGDFDRSAFTSASPHQIGICTKRSDVMLLTEGECPLR